VRRQAENWARALSLTQAASAAYDPAVKQTKDWRRLSPQEISKHKIKPELFFNENSGFKAGLYENKRGELALAFAGTDFSSSKDRAANVRQSLGFETQQFQQAANLGLLVKRNIGEHVMVTGHSKGGGQAIFAGVVAGLRTVTFNPSGVHKNTFARFDLDRDKIGAVLSKTDKVQNYIAKGEILDIVNGLPIMPSPIGQRISMKSGMIKAGTIKRHRLGHVVKLIKERNDAIIKKSTTTLSLADAKTALKENETAAREGLKSDLVIAVKAKNHPMIKQSEALLKSQGLAPKMLDQLRLSGVKSLQVQRFKGDNPAQTVRAVLKSATAQYQKQGLGQSKAPKSASRDR